MTMVEVSNCDTRIYFVATDYTVINDPITKQPMIVKRSSGEPDYDRVRYILKTVNMKVEGIATRSDGLWCRMLKEANNGKRV